MSSKKTAKRRVALFTGSSLVAASLTAFASLGGVFLPSTAAAQSVCTPNPNSGAGTNTVGYTGTQSSGIVCTATGNFVLNKTSGIASSTTAYALDISSTGTTTVNVAGAAANIGAAVSQMPNGSGALDLSGAAGGATLNFAGTSNTGGRWLGSGASVFGAGNDTVNFQGIGFNYVGGRGDLAAASVDFGAGDDTINLASFLNIGGHTQEAGSIDFGTGNDAFNISGVFASHGGELANLESLNLSGTIFMGTGKTNTPVPNVVWTGADVTADDVLRLHGATFTGSGAGRIVMDVVLGADAQVGCETVVTADCLDLRDGSTAGSTLLVLNDVSPDTLLSGYVPQGITIVDVAGSGSSSATHFTLDPASTDGYVNPLYGAAFDRPGHYVYLFRYDAENQRHVLISQPKSSALFDYAILSGAAQSIWHLTTETVTDRQTELRDGAVASSVWLRTAGEVTRRDQLVTFEGWDDTYTFDNSYKLYAGTIMGGLDLISGTSGDYGYVLGGQIGYVSSSFDLDAAESSGRMTGATGGVYGSIWSERLFVDGTFNMNGLTLDHESPELGAKTNTYLNSIGARLDGGYRMMLTERTYLEPLASAAWVRTSFEEISLSGGQIQPADAQSRRVALGARLGADLTEGPINVSYFVAGRAWNEFDGETDGVIHNSGADLPFADEFSGGFGEAEAGVTLFNDTGTLSGFLSSGVKFKDGYNATNISLGLRMSW